MVHNRRLLLLIISLPLIACRAASSLTPTIPATPVTVATGESTTAIMTEDAMSLTDGFELSYTAAGGRPFVQTMLHISPAGQAELYLGSSWSLPLGNLDTVGFFAGQVPTNSWHSLQTYLTTENVLAHPGSGPATSPDMASRQLTLRQGGQEHTITIADTSQAPTLAKLEEMLLEIMTGLVTKPLQAARVTLDLPVNGRGAEPQLTITNAGSEPLSLVLFSAANVNQYMHVEVHLEQRFTLPSGIDMWPPVSSAAASRADIMTLVETGAFPEGSHTLAPGAAHSFSLAEIALPGSSQPLYARSVITFWLATDGEDFRSVTVQTARIELDESPDS